jgi:nicotinate phosphoribosyltransferase
MSYRYGLSNRYAIDNGNVTDAYFERTEEALAELDSNPRVKAEVTADQFSDGESEVFCGLKEACELLEGLPLNMYALPEGSEFDGRPVMLIEGHYEDFARYETALLGLLSQSSGYATAARRVSEAAGEDTPVLSFGSRHIHPGLAPYMERAAAVGGVDGYSNIGARHAMDDEPSGTMPHALMLSQGKGNQERAWSAFDRSVDEDVPRTVLVDTFTDEVDETMRACDELGDDLDAVRLDTTGSRRGDFKHIIREVRFHLDKRGRDEVEIFVSGGIDVDAIEELKEYVDGFGVGSFITDANPVDFGLDIVELDGEDISKRGKLPGVKANIKSPTPKQYINSGEIVREVEK